MKGPMAVAALVCTLAWAAPVAAPEHFRFARSVEVGTAPQAYFLVDRVMWSNMRRDLGDMRLYAGGTEVPYVLQVQRGGHSSSLTEAKMFDLGERSGTTEFKLRVAAEEYDTVSLRIKTKNFVTQASVEGSNDESGWARLGSATLFDFSDEKLGSNLDIKLSRPAHYRFLRIQLAGHVPAKDVATASVATENERDSGWLTFAEISQAVQSGRDTVFEWNAEAMPLEQVRLVISEPELNFYRSAELFDGDGGAIATGEFSRVHLRRDGRQVDHENLGLDVPYTASTKRYKLVIHNGDDRPLPIETLHARSYQRRVYFQPSAGAKLRLYFGDEKLEPPAYDYARFFREDPQALVATLAPSTANTQFRPRPDDRPWSERHKWVLWSALIVAVVGLGSVALRGLKANA